MLIFKYIWCVDRENDHELSLFAHVSFKWTCIEAVWKCVSRIYWHPEQNVKVPLSRIIHTNFHRNHLYAAGICTDEMPFKSVLYSSSEPSVFLHWTIALWIACLKCLYCCPQPLLAITKWLSLSRHARAHTHTHTVRSHFVCFIQWPYRER